MPITIAAPVRRYSQEEFGTVAYEVVRCAFEVHEALGRVFHESIYRSTLREILGYRAIEELQISLIHEGFCKDLYLDLLVDLGCPFELKAVSSLTDGHQSQLIQYLMLTGLTHGKLINFGTERVEHRFVNCLETPEQRRVFQIQRIDWLDVGSSRHLESIIVPLLKDWGTGLCRSLYQEAIIALAGGEEQCRQFTETQWQGRRTGQQPVYMIEPDVSFVITCKKHNLNHQATHLRRFLINTTLNSILWANITSGCVRLQKFVRD